MSIMKKLFGPKGESESESTPDAVKRRRIEAEKKNVERRLRLLQSEVEVMRRHYG